MCIDKINANAHHIAISVQDLDAEIRFYRDLLGFEVDWDIDHYSGEGISRVVGLLDVDAHVVMLKGFGTRIELFKYYTPAGDERGPKRQCDFGLTHFALTVKNIHKLYECLSDAGVRFHCPPENLRPGVWATYMKDPEGVTIELVQYD